MILVKTKIKKTINFSIYSLKLVQKNIVVLYRIMNKKNIDLLTWTLVIAFVWSIIIIVNMNAYIEYIKIKYSNNTPITYNNSYNIVQSDIEAEKIDFNSAIDYEYSEKDIKVNESNTQWEITSWWWKTDNNINIELNKIRKTNTIKAKTEIINLPIIKSEPEIIKQTVPIKSSTVWNEINTKESDKVVNNSKENVNNINNTSKIKIINNIDYISISINDEIQNRLNLLNSDILNSFNIKIINSRNLVLENWVWYTYVFSKYDWFWKWIIPTESEIYSESLNIEKDILLLDNDNWISFVREYKKIKLISDDIVSDISNKENFLMELADEKKYITDDTDSLFLQLKKDTKNLTKELTDNKKIQKIYNYILKNTNFSKTFDVNNKYIFSWIYTYKNKDWICSGYAKLYLYMLSFAWIDNVKLIKWNVIDSPDFPNIWHAWIQIWYNYYDPTFDDPIWNNTAKLYSEYKYFWLPKDLFYTNRFNYWTLPEYIKNSSLDIRKDYINNELIKLLPKYSKNNYNILKPYVFKQKYWFETKETITIEKLKKVIPYFEVNDYKYIDNNIEISIKDSDYYTISDSNIESILEKVWYDIEWLILFKWDNWTYRLAYKIS